MRLVRVKGISYSATESCYLVRYAGEYVGRFKYLIEAKAALLGFVKASMIDWQAEVKRLGLV